MKNNKMLIVRTFELLTIIILYHIIGVKSIFTYVLSISLYNIFMSYYDNVTVLDCFKRITGTTERYKIFKLLLPIFTLISLFFFTLCILISDLTSIFLKINDILPVFIFLGISIITRPLIRLISEYLACQKNNNKYLNIPYIHMILDNILLIIIAFLSYRVFNLKEISASASLYLSKIISSIIIISFIYHFDKLKTINVTYNNVPVNRKKEVKKILTNNATKSTINIVKKSYYYISIIILYLVLSTRYDYKITDLEKIITFIYFFAIEIITYMVDIIGHAIKKTNMPVVDKVYLSLKTILPFSIIMAIISPLLCFVLFNDPSKSIYLSMVSFIAVFTLLYDVIYDNIKNKKVIFISLIVGLIAKITLIIPLINSFYRLGYNLVYGDIVSTITALFISVLINYIYLKTTAEDKINYFEKLLGILYENILLCIILLLLEFIIPTHNQNYLKSIGISLIYIIIGLTFIKVKNMKRG